MKLLWRYLLITLCTILGASSLRAMNSGNSTDDECDCTTYMGRRRSLTLVLPPSPSTLHEDDEDEEKERSQSARTKRRKNSPPRREISTIVSPRKKNETAPVPLLQLNAPPVHVYDSPPLQVRNNDNVKKEEDFDETEDELSSTPSSEHRKRSSSSIGNLTPRSLKSALKKRSDKKKEKKEKRVQFKDEQTDSNEQLEHQLETYPMTLADILRIEIIPQVESDEPVVNIRIALQPLMEDLAGYIDDEDIEASQLEDPRTLGEDIEACYQALVAILEWRIENNYLESRAQQRLRFLKLLYPLFKNHLDDDLLAGAITGMNLENWIEALKTMIQTKSDILTSQERARQITLGLHLGTCLSLSGDNTQQAFLLTLDMLSTLLITSLLESHEGIDTSEVLTQWAFDYMLRTAHHAETDANTFAAVLFNRIAMALFRAAHALNNTLPSSTHSIKECKAQTRKPLKQLFATE